MMLTALWLFSEGLVTGLSGPGGSAWTAGGERKCGDSPTHTTCMWMQCTRRLPERSGTGSPRTSPFW